MAFTSILILLETDSDETALAKLIERLIKRTDAKFSLLGIAPDFSVPVFKTPQTAQTARELAAKTIGMLEEKIELLSEKFPENSNTAIVSGNLVEEVAKATIIHQADLVLKAASVSVDKQGPFFGSIDKRLVRNCPAPVWIVRSDRDFHFDHIVVAIDRHDIYKNAREREELSRSLLDHAVKLATFFKVETVDVVFAWDAVGADMLRSSRSGLSVAEAKEYMDACEKDNERWLEDFITDIQKNYNPSAPKLIPQLIFGRPKQVLVKKVHELEADIMILGTIARSGALGFLIGNTAEEVLDQVECSVLTIKPAKSNIVEDA